MYPQNDAFFSFSQSLLYLLSNRIMGFELSETNQGYKCILSYDVASGSEITPCNKIDQPLVVYRFAGNVMMPITTLRT